MVFRSWRLLPLLWTILCLLGPGRAVKLFESTSLNNCMKGSAFSASLFGVTFTPNNRTITYNVKGFSEIQANVILDVKIWIYGYELKLDALKKPFDPCEPTPDPKTGKDGPKFAGLCPMNAADLEMNSNFVMDPPKSANDDNDIMKKIPAVGFFVPDLDIKAHIWINDTTTSKPLACLEVDLANGQTVHQSGVAWSIALIVLLSLVSSAVISGLGHSNTASHIAANALALFGYFQALALIGMTAVTTPPIVRAWTQNFQWSMGIIRVDFLQRMATWYQRATGGKPSTYISGLETTSVQVLKRAVITNSKYANLKSLVVRGIERVGFVGNIELTNIFFTSYLFFVIFIVLTTIGVLLFKHGCELFIRMGKMRPEKFHEFRTGWRVMLKGILFRIVLITFPQMVVMCFWEITKRDSPAQVVLAITSVVAVIVCLGLASLKVWNYARRSIELHQNPAYILYSDMTILNKWGFLYIQFKAQMYFFIIPMLLYTLVKSLFIGLAQGSGKTQSVAIIVLELAMLIAISTMRPFMDKKTNVFNIAIAAVNFINATFLLFFTGVFGLPPLAIGIMGVLFFLLNVVFALVIILMVVWTSVSAIISKNPETRYQPMRDDRGSFVKSQNDFNTELDALGATARGDTGLRRVPLDDEPLPVVYNLRQQDFERSTSRQGRPRFAENEYGNDFSKEWGKDWGKEFGASHDSFSANSAISSTGSLQHRGSHTALVPAHMNPHPRSPLPDSGFRSPLGPPRTQTQSPMSRAASPANFWKQGVGY
ncbi:hypothetical protein EG328_008613 [Venturia inaequalis]|uniref:ML-like domain-containing protein n=2 Tax=Venturia inaequalis TaxID=5025 RepID=A0A8H3UB89_VENIN|nr:hypothetical protein EG328_008613 [Venturia inaequalis]